MTRTEWDYSTLAATYADRPDYAVGFLDDLASLTGVQAGDAVADIGAGSGHLTIPLLRAGYVVDAVEPNDEMRAVGVRRTEGRGTVHWHDATGQSTGLARGAYSLVTFGSSFNVAPAEETLPETARILRPRGWMACVWNHRDLEDPLQSRIESTIRRLVPSYSHGARRADQTDVIAASGLFEPAHASSHRVLHTVDTDSWLRAWSSHATLARAAGDGFGSVVDAIVELVRGEVGESMVVPYVSKGWIARLQERG